jgi:flavin reductase (DIM6/NTAB) family NADH-FMN oxidoreductase RutF
VAPEDFQRAFGNVAGTVATVTALADGVPHGTTVTAFCALSLRPPLLLAALDRSSVLLGALAVGTPFGVNVLSEEQSDIATSCAGKGKDKLSRFAWHERAGAVRLEGVAGWFACVVDALVPAGDHVIVVGAVSEAQATDAAPLIYFRRGFAGVGT